jgi:hypothetical protein
MWQGPSLDLLRQGEARRLPTCYNERNFFFLLAVVTTSGRISGDSLRLLYTLSHRQATNYVTRMGILDPSPPAFKQRRDTYFYYNRAVIGITCAQATAMRIDIAPHKRPRRKPPQHVPKQPRMVGTFLKVHTRRRLAYALGCRGY